MPCGCNISGSIEHFCDTHTGQCPCKMGVEGLRCDECEEGFYGLSSDGCQGKSNSNGVFFVKCAHKIVQKEFALLFCFVLLHLCVEIYGDHKTDKLI